MKICIFPFDVYNQICFYVCCYCVMSILLLILLTTIPVSVIFSKAWVKWVNAFVPFKNAVTYMKITDFKYKYSVTLFILLLSFFLLSFEFDGKFWWLWWCFIILFFLLLSIPSSVIFWIVIWLARLSGQLFQQLWIHWSISRGDVIVLYLWSFFILICLPIFYCKLAYDLALKFWRKPWAAVLYVIFQPIAIWILAFWKWEYQGDYSKTQNNKNWNDMLWNSSELSDNSKQD